MHDDDDDDDDDDDPSAKVSYGWASRWKLRRHRPLQKNIGGDSDDKDGDSNGGDNDEDAADGFLTALDVYTKELVEKTSRGDRAGISLRWALGTLYRWQNFFYFI